MDEDSVVWTIPASRMKTQREHRVPLCGRAPEILEADRKPGNGESPVVFLGERGRLVGGKRSPGFSLRCDRHPLPCAQEEKPAWPRAWQIPSRLRPQNGDPRTSDVERPFIGEALGPFKVRPRRAVSLVDPVGGGVEHCRDAAGERQGGCENDQPVGVEPVPASVVPRVLWTGRSRAGTGT